MKYKAFKQVLPKENFFKSWDSNQLENITEQLKQKIYEKYMVKCEVFNRDHFKCQNKDCKYTTAITMHHVKAKRNGGKDLARNCVTLCDTCHKAFERGKKPLIFPKDAMHLPNHMRGHTFRLSIEEKAKWKDLKVEMKKLRKSLKTSRTSINWDQIDILMRWLELLVEE